MNDEGKIVLWETFGDLVNNWKPIIIVYCTPERGSSPSINFFPYSFWIHTAEDLEVNGVIPEHKK